MQRKNNNNDAKNRKEQDERKAILTAAAARQNNNRSRTVTNDLDSSVQKNDNLPRKRDSMEIEQEQSTDESSNSVILLELASVTDMHGIGSDLIGRRSFGGFHKSVHTTWEGALKRRTDNESGERGDGRT